MGVLYAQGGGGKGGACDVKVAVNLIGEIEV